MAPNKFTSLNSIRGNSVFQVCIMNNGKINTEVEANPVNYIGSHKEVREKSGRSHGREMWC